MQRFLVNILRLLLLAVVLFWPPMYFYLDVFAKRVSQEANESHAKDTAFVVEHSRQLMAGGVYVDACAFLKKSATDGKIALYSLNSSDIQCSHHPELNPESFKTQEFNKIHSVQLPSGLVDYARYQSSEAELLVAKLRPQVETAWTYFSKNPRDFIESFIVDTTVALWLVAALWVMWVLKNLQQMRALYGQLKNQPLWYRWIEKISRLYSFGEMEQISAIQKSAALQIEKLQKEKIYQSETLEYALLEEIASSPQAKESLVFPYKFVGVVARVDINFYSSYIYDGNRMYLQQMKKTFDWLAAECAYRYRGLFEGRAGDEVVYCFKGENQEFRALAFVRDFMQALSSQRFNFYNKENQALFVKASLAKSLLSMEASPSKFDFDGDALYFTNRMFGELPYKDKNILIVFPDFYPQIHALAEKPFEQRTVTNKEATLVVDYIDQFPRYAKCIEADESLAEYFMGDAGLIDQLSYFADSAAPADKRLRLTKQLLAKVRVKRASNLVASQWLEALASVNVQAKSDRSLEDLESSLMSLGAHIVNSHNWNESLSRKVTQMAIEGSERLQANAVETLSKWSDFDSALELASQCLTRYPERKNARLRANILLAKGMRSLSEEVFADLLDMLKVSDRDLRQSAFYASSVLILHWRESNPSELALYRNYFSLLGALAQFKDSSSERLLSLREKVVSHAH